MTVASEHLPRDERRRRTEAGILRSARELFAETGYERATIRAVAARAGVDPALVMQYYGNKEQLFSAVANQPSWDPAEFPVSALPEAALAEIFDNFEEPGDRDAALVLLRSCLTHPAATTKMRDEVLCERVAAIARQLRGPDAELRASLFAACLTGLAMSRYLLGVEPLASADRADIERILAPVLHALLEPGGAPDVPL